ncbi:MAG: zinc ribbon domain-containing protein [Anaerolineae bacterium]|nr:zinc ribbon domain-containing protein [Anaerolineae bacterium]
MNQFRKYDPLDPDNREAAESLQRLARPSPPLETESSTVPGNMLRCPQCGGTMEVRFIGELRDKRAGCPYCGTEVDLPDSYQRIERHHEQQTDMLSSRTVDRIVVQTRSDGAAVPEAGQEVLESLFQQRTESLATLETEELPGCLGWLTHLLPGSVTRANVKLHPPFVVDKVQRGGVPAGSLGPDADMQLAGGALPPEERRPCPHCGATISKHATRCAWCGTFLAPSE